MKNTILTAASDGDAVTLDYRNFSHANTCTQIIVRAFSGCRHTDWELCETIRRQELNEIRQRASQMENTMRWWSQCTASWRQKWDMVRRERNQARDELTRIRNALNDAKKEIHDLTYAKEAIEAEICGLRKKSIQKENNSSSCLSQNRDLKSPTLLTTKHKGYRNMSTQTDKVDFNKCNNMESSIARSNDENQNQNKTRYLVKKTSTSSKNQENNQQQSIEKIEFKRFKSPKNTTQQRTEREERYNLNAMMAIGNSSFSPSSSNFSSSTMCSPPSSTSSYTSTKSFILGGGGDSVSATVARATEFTTNGETPLSTSTHQYGSSGVALNPAVK